MLFQAGRLKYAKCPPLQLPPKSLRITEKISFKIHNHSSKQGSSSTNAPSSRNNSRTSATHLSCWDQVQRFLQERATGIGQSTGWGCTRNHKATPTLPYQGTPSGRTSPDSSFHCSSRVRKQKQ